MANDFVKKNKFKTFIIFCRYELSLGFIYSTICFIEFTILFGKIFNNYWIGVGFGSIFVVLGIIFTTIAIILKFKKFKRWLNDI